MSGHSKPNPARIGGVLLNGAAMDAMAQALAGCPVTQDAALESEFEQRLADSSKLAYRVALGVLRNHADAEEVAQEAFVRAYRSFHLLREREKFRGWLARIAWRLALDRIRASKRREQRELASMPRESAQSVEDVAAHSEFEHRVQQAIDALPEKLRIVVVLAAIQGHEMSEVARLLELPEGTVKSRLHLARKELAAKLR